MVELTRLVAAEIGESYDFSGADLVMDVGGGHGELLAAVLERNPRLRGVLFEQEHALTGAQSHFAQRGLEQRIELSAGDFFDAVPPGADVYMMKSILHDWSDMDAARILRNFERVMAPRSRLLVIEHLMPEVLEPTALHRALDARDLHMMVALGAAERTRAQFVELLHATGFVAERVITTPTTFSIIEARRAS
jgi:ubiquinone/menaquinone biosynthesis C-methylase UbiE